MVKSTRLGTTGSYEEFIERNPSSIGPKLGHTRIDPEVLDGADQRRAVTLRRMDKSRQ